MYHAVQKDQFIDSKMLMARSKQKDKYRDTWVNFFDRLEKFESFHGKDFAQMNHVEIVGLLGEFLTGGKLYQSSSLGKLSEYLDWAIESGYSAFEKNILKGIRLKDLNVNTLNTIMVKDETDLLACLSEVLRSPKEETIDNMYWCFLLVLFAGATVEQALLIKCGDVELERRAIRISGRQSIAISDALYVLLKEHYLGLEYYVHYVSNGRARYDSIIRSPENYLLENTVALEEKLKPEYRRKKMMGTWNVALSNKFAKCSRRLNLTNIRMSGIFYRMYQKELITGEPDCSEYMEVKKNNAITLSTPNYVTNVCVHEYGAWKKAFY